MSYSCGTTVVVTLLLLLVVASSLALTANADSFESLLQLPRRQSRSTRPRSERLLHVGKFGAKGNGFTDDTKVNDSLNPRETSLHRKNGILNLNLSGNLLSVNLYIGSMKSDSTGKYLIVVSDDHCTQAFADAWKTACSSKVKTRILVPENYTCLLRPIDLSGPCKARLTLQVKPSPSTGYFQIVDLVLLSLLLSALFCPLDLWYNHCSQ